MIYFYTFILFMVYLFGVMAAMSVYNDFFGIEEDCPWLKLLFGLCWPVIVFVGIISTMIGVLIMNLIDCYTTHFLKDK
jgi:hypothetical protein